ncbi:hypothetical protein cyc_07778 [Cyclospora cayetanensis]|uniref:Uncharacterized protein n=1 Tax=Cyclospora cayetanensis TaxID=88456 RepID=A0A1D3D066_9EIME|nr:hypothetical protein cyc_07778 [Cyclospora cayetanensis]
MASLAPKWCLGGAVLGSGSVQRRRAAVALQPLEQLALHTCKKPLEESLSNSFCLQRAPSKGGPSGGREGVRGEEVSEESAALSWWVLLAPAALGASRRGRMLLFAAF